MLDVIDERRFDTRCTFIDPYPERLLSVLIENDRSVHEVIARKVQDVDLSRFSELSEGDILFIDCSHVSKLDSDVNWYLFEILPRLNSGVFIHIHDIEFPFEYSTQMLEAGCAWNEAYALRAFFSYNNAFAIEFWTAFMLHYYGEVMRRTMPLCRENAGGSFWCRKV